VDFFTVPTVTFKVLFVFVVLAHHRRRVVHVNVTDAPTAQWTAQQLVEAFPWETAPRYLLRDRDAVYGVVFSSRAQTMGIHEVKTAPRSPWQKAYASHCTSLQPWGTISAAGRRRDSFTPWALLGAWAPGGA
jgi:hypothetical protein